MYLRIFFTFIFFVSLPGLRADYPRNQHVEEEVWNRLKPYFLPVNHPIKPKLDKIFSKYRAIIDEDSLVDAGFKAAKPRQWTRLVVTSHPKVPGYLFKLYFDRQRYHEKKPEHHFWELRIKGAALIREEIQKRGLQGIFKVPNKWIYPLPSKPSPPKNMIRKNFILVVEDMKIYDDEKNAKQWLTNPLVTKDFLTIFFSFVNDLGLWDCAKIANAPFAKDGKVAFIDTQSFHRWPVKLDRLTPALTPEMQAHWNLLIQSQSK